MVKQTQVALSDATEWLGAWHPLAEQLGSADGLLTLCSVSSMLQLQPVTDVDSFVLVLRNYQSRILLEFELPSIDSAYDHASRNEVRELVALDQQLVEEPILRNFADASRRVGQCQLQKLRPLRDQRMLQRFLQAVDAGHAHGWHTLVYGLTLWVYSLPLRQGLLGYAHQTIRGFIYSAARNLRLSERDCRALFDELCADLPEAVEGLIRRRDAA